MWNIYAVSETIQYRLARTISYQKDTGYILKTRAEKLEYRKDSVSGYFRVLSHFL